jgi:hypothetical protein
MSSTADREIPAPLPKRVRFEGIDEMPAIKHGLGHSRSSATILGLAALSAALVMVQPSFAQKIHSYEPLMMDPYSTIYVDDGSCSAGKVLRVQGAPNNQRRKKSCVPMSDLKSVPGPGAPK